MVKRGVSAIFIFVFSVLLIASFSGFIRAVVCTAGGTNIPQCQYVTSQSLCDGSYSSACHWTGYSCEANSVYCRNVDVPDCSLIRCSGGTQCVIGSGPCCDSSGNYRLSSYQCDKINSFFMCNEATDIIRVEGWVRYCSGGSSSCNGGTAWIVQAPSYASCSALGGCIDDFFFPNTNPIKGIPSCTCEGTDQTLPPSGYSICSSWTSTENPGCVNSCVDSDSGLSYTTSGYTYRSGYIPEGYGGSSGTSRQDDYCSSTTTLQERYCSSTYTQATSSYSCTNLGSGYSCSGGRCVCTANCAGLAPKVVS